MTGFGSAEDQVLGGRLRVEIRTVNHRYFNPQLKLPSELAAVETELRDRLRQLLVERAGREVIGMGEREGRAWAAELVTGLEALERGAQTIVELAPARLKSEHTRLRQAVVDLMAGRGGGGGARGAVDEQRLA